MDLLKNIYKVIPNLGIFTKPSKFPIRIQSLRFSSKIVNQTYRRLKLLTKLNLGVWSLEFYFLNATFLILSTYNLQKSINHTFQERLYFCRSFFRNVYRLLFFSSDAFSKILTQLKKQLSRDILRKSYSENMQQRYYGNSIRNKDLKSGVYSSFQLTSLI